MSLGRRLKIARINKGLKQKEAANQLNISNVALSSYERDISDPDTETLKSLAEFYGVTSDYLIDVNPDKVGKPPKHPLDDTVHEALHEMDASDIQLLTTEDIDKETANAIKMALQNGIKLVDSMRQREYESED